MSQVHCFNSRAWPPEAGHAPRLASSHACSVLAFKCAGSFCCYKREQAAILACFHSSEQGSPSMPRESKDCASQQTAAGSRAPVERWQAAAQRRSGKVAARGALFLSSPFHRGTQIAWEQSMG